VTPAAAAAALEQRLRAVGSPDRAEHERAYLKSDLEFVGVGVPAIRAAATALWRSRDLDRPELLELVDLLWDRGIHECRMAAVELLDLGGPLLRAGDIALLERLVRESRTWALVDGLAASVIGPLAERCPELASTLDRWASDDDLWVRRAALLAHLPALRRGEGDFERFAGYADRMLEEREFFIRKAIGWVLRDTARRRPQLVTAWLAPRVHRASGVTVREAVKHLPAPDRDALLHAYRRGTPADVPTSG
jgi:3-methyladenine DNA glycosylase AlkD